MYGRINNGEFEQAPITFVTPDGKTICNFNRKPAIMIQYGFREVHTSPCPDYDFDKQYPVDIYTLEDGEIYQTWEIREYDEVTNAD